MLALFEGIMATLLLVGATGLVGREVLRLALAHGKVERVIALTRRPLAAHPHLENPLVDFDHLPATWWKADAVICTLGTTIKQAGSQEAFRKVDHGYPLAVARRAREQGARAFAYNSSIGADLEARSFYLRVKGETERDLESCGFPSLTVVRPSAIGGKRDESRPAERLAIALLEALRPLVPRHYRVVPAERIAVALIEAALAAVPGRHVIESEDL
jgi:uncharacterized protein YbjT (DUF2867 family)